MLLYIIGSAGVGMVWGWLAAGAADPRLNSPASVLTVALGTSIVGAAILFVGSWTGIPAFIGAALVTYILRAAAPSRHLPAAQPGDRIEEDLP